MEVQMLLKYQDVTVEVIKEFIESNYMKYGILLQLLPIKFTKVLPHLCAMRHNEKSRRLCKNANFIPWSYVPRKLRSGCKDPRKHLPMMNRFTLSQRRIYVYNPSFSYRQMYLSKYCV